MQNFRDAITEVGEHDHDSEAFFDMANLFSKHTGLPFVVWISCRGGAQHDVRVKVSPSPRALPSQMASVAVRPSTRLVEACPQAIWHCCRSGLTCTAT